MKPLRRGEQMGKMGRPPLKATERRRKLVGVHVSERNWKQIEPAIRRSGETASTFFLRAALERARKF